ncbi:SGNH/GDSL hydrolase family protein [Actinoplanes bogorensis]|uniref:SGNH/GDSL hydrolase family protein n=1 Tax=Paractinoplanes bogorensis TaxID=1610840 RepID=A0ABS5YKN0_9ACTN|nr:SGNH/GDSL hydrolase family protein [Actinoplanes bogorensis]MBU2664030.1 SGNH/GDSL hydrolase family protein [Actinoplanes bogorensis]
MAARRRKLPLVLVAVCALIAGLPVPAWAADAPTMPVDGVVDVVVTRVSSGSWPNYVTVGDNSRLCSGAPSPCSARSGWFAAGTVLAVYAKEGDGGRALREAERRELGPGHWLFTRTLSSGHTYTVEVTAVAQAKPATPVPTSAAPTPTPSPAPPVPDAYVALGDSYASGEGSPNETYEKGTTFTDKDTPRGQTGCHRSSRSWAHGVSAAAVEKGLLKTKAESMTFVACSGAVLEDLFYPNETYTEYGEYEDPQIDAVIAKTPKLVTLSIGGNDAGFADILKDCVDRMFHRGFGCRNRSGKKGAAGIVAERLVPLEQDRIVFEHDPGHVHSLADAYIAIARRMAPGGRLVVTGYPLMFAESKLLYTRVRNVANWGRFDCRIGTAEAVISAYISYEDGQWLNDMAERLNEAIRRSVVAANAQLRITRPGVEVDFVTVTEEFKGHRLCSGDRWLNGAVIPFNPKGLPGPAKQSFHPNKEGQEAYVRAVSKVL